MGAAALPTGSTSFLGGCHALIDVRLPSAKSDFGLRLVPMSKNPASKLLRSGLAPAPCQSYSISTFRTRSVPGWNVPS
jgi:hypothetical protein